MTSSPSGWTAGTGARPTLHELRRREDHHRTIVARRAGEARRLKTLTATAAALLKEVVETHLSDGRSLPTNLVTAVTGQLHPSSWNRYAASIRPWLTYTRAHGLAVLPANPVDFAQFLAEAGARDAGYSQTKFRVNAIRSLSELAGLASPHTHPLVAGYRRGVSRTKGASRRGSVRPIFGSEIPDALPQPALGTAQGGRGRGRPHHSGHGRSLSLRSQLARIASVRQAAVLHDGAMRYDDLQEAQLGDTLHFADVIDLSLFGTKTDRTLSGQSAVLPRSSEPNSGCQGLLQNAREGLRRLAALELPVLTTLAHRFQASSATSRQAGPEALVTWPDDIRALANQLYPLGMPVHRLPIYGRWLFDDLSADTDLAATLSSQEFVRLTRVVLNDAGVDTTRFGAHSFGRGRAVAMYHGQAGDAAVSSALRHRDPRSAAPYVLAPARMSALAASMRASAPLGRGQATEALGGALGQPDRSADCRPANSATDGPPARARPVQRRRKPPTA